ncbi:uncharacterized protein LOC120344316 [Styela clava]
MITSKPQSIPKSTLNSTNRPNLQTNQSKEKQSVETFDNNFENGDILLCLNPVEDLSNQNFLSQSREKKKVIFKNPIIQDDSIKSENPKKRSKSKKQPQVTTEVVNRSKKSLLKVSVPYHFDNGLNVTWRYTSTRWAERLEHLSQLAPGAIKVVQSKSSNDASAFYCENQSHFILGNGPDFSTSMLGILNKTTEVLIKKINVKRVPLLLNEVHVKSLVSLPKSPHIAHIYFIVKDKTHFYVVRELGENSLRYVMRMRQYLFDSTKQPLEYKQLCHSIAKSLAVLHGSDVVHMAIKPENVFVTNSGNAILSDYGMHSRSETKKQQLSNGSGSLCWLPSEALGKVDKPQYNKASDIAPLGMLFYYIITEGKHPFGDPESAADTCMNNILHGQYNLKLITDPLAHHLIQNMIYKEPEKRFSIDKILSHPYFWSDSEKNVFVKYLVKIVAFVLNDDICDKKANGVLQKIRLEGSHVIQNFVEIGSCLEIPSKLKNNLTAILQYVFEFSKSKTHDLKENDIFRDFCNMYPGLLLDYYSEITIEDMTNMVDSVKRAAVEKVNQYPDFIDLRTLKSTLSADSGVVSPSMDVPVAKGNGKERNIGEYYDIDTFSFDSKRTRNRNYSDCCTSTTTDDGIDLLSPMSGSFTDENMFSSPVKIFPNNSHEYSDKWKSSNHSIISPGSSIDNHYEFDGLGYSNSVPDCREETSMKSKRFLASFMPLWTDMDELD